MKNLLKSVVGKVKFPIRLKLIIIFTLLVALISAFIYMYFPRKLERQAIALLADKAQSITRLAAFNVSPALVFEDKHDLGQILESFKQDKEIVYIVVHDSRGEVFNAFNHAAAVRADYRLHLTAAPISEDELIYRTKAPIIHRKRQIGQLFLGMSLESLWAQVTRSKHTTTLVSAVLFFVGVLAVLLISTVITNPLKKMVHTIEDISAGDLSRRASFSSHDEVGNLAAAFNLMVENLEKYSNQLKELNITLEDKVAERTEKLQVEVYERRLAQEALEKSEEKYRRLVNNSLVGIYITQDHCLKFCNQQFAEIFGYDTPRQILGIHMKELLTGESWSQRSREQRSGLPAEKNPERYELKGVHKNGTVFDIEVLENRIHYLGNTAIEGILIDITTRKQAEMERKRLENRLRQAQKMESLGILAGGIAHDFNNLLGVIIGYTELTLSDLPGGSTGEDNLQRVLLASQQAVELVKQILAFSRKREERRRQILLSSVVDDALKLIRSTLPTTIDIRRDIAAQESPVLANKSEIHQVILNLCANAAYAMREKGGILTITLKEIDLEPGSISSVHLEPGRYERLTISDTGCGITPDIIERIFEPYFTTKKDGEGTGMGLAVAHGIVKGYGGDITVYSEPGTGTAFYIFLPVTEEKGAEYVERPEEPIKGGSERILFVDDENLLAEMTRDMLTEMGYRVEIRTGSIEALEVFRANPGGFDLVITDQTMPYMTGLQLTKEIRKIRRNIPIILCSGYSESVNEENYRIHDIDAFILKPVTKKIMDRTIREVLDKK